MIEVTLHRGQPDQHETLANLAQLYVHDFMDFIRPGRLDVDETGRFADEMHLEDFWTRPDHAVWFIRAGGKLVGFALINRKTQSGQPADYNMAQFFVMRQYRIDTIAARAARGLIDAHPGQWEIAIMEGNAPALRFWPKAVALTRVTQLDSFAQESGGVKRALIRFLVKAP